MVKNEGSKIVKDQKNRSISIFKNKKFKNIPALILIIIVAAIGARLLLSSHAESPYASVEAESGALAGGATIFGDTNASAGNGVSFEGSSSCAPSGVCVPVGNISGWTQTYETNFPGTVPLGAFSGCENGSTNTLTYCTGLESYGSYYNDWWAYPSGWADTAEECLEGLSGCPYPASEVGPGKEINPTSGGEYEPQEAVSVSNNAMHINESSPGNGAYNVVATVVPRACMNQTYGMYTERFKVVQEDPGFKSAHLLISPSGYAYYETDYPENDYGSTISAYTHPGGANFSTTANWTSWHTTTIEWTPNSFQFYMDGNLIGTSTTDVANVPMSWILQNESSIVGPYAPPGATAEFDIAWVACYTYN